MSNISKGNYARLKTKKWYEKEGYAVETIEKKVSVFVKGRVMFVSKDVFASDLLAMNGEDIVFIQVKTNSVDISKAIKAFHKYPFPSYVTRHVVRWEPRVREPTVVVV